MTIRFQADNDFKFTVVRSIRRKEPSIDFASAEDAHLDGVSDPDILERAANDGRVVVSHDCSTMLKHFRDRLLSRRASPGLIIAPQDASIGALVESIILLWAILDAEELRDCVYHVPSLMPYIFPR